MYLNTFMKYYKFLELNWMPAAHAMKDYVIANPSLYKAGVGAWVPCDFLDVMRKVPELQIMFNPLGLTVKRVSLFVMTFKTGKIHIDDDAIHPFRINFPILNCKDTETRFYKVTQNPTTERQLNSIAYHFFNPSNCELVDSFELDRPVIFKTQEPHQVVVNHNKLPRISCTIAFHEDLESLFNRLP
jgi:hypothetical protein